MMQVTDHTPQLDDFYHIPESIKSEVLKILSDLELKHNIKIIFAIESGSRAWGFASKDSDYDVRFVYMHDPEWYLNIVEQYTEVENNGAINLPINGDLDIAGWDLKKALSLSEDHGSGHPWIATLNLRNLARTWSQPR